MFEEEVVLSTRGMQSSKWDEYYPRFNEPGKTLWAPLKEVSGPAAAQFAARMRVIEERKGGSRVFHSGVDKITGRSFVRVRFPGEVPDKDEANEEGDSEDTQEKSE